MIEPITRREQITLTALSALLDEVQQLPPSVKMPLLDFIATGRVAQKQYKAVIREDIKDTVRRYNKAPMNSVTESKY